MGTSHQAFLSASSWNIWITVLLFVMGYFLGPLFFALAMLLPRRRRPYRLHR